MYSEGRYLTMSGNHLENTPLGIEKREVAALYRRLADGEYVFRTAESKPGANASVTFDSAREALGAFKEGSQWKAVCPICGHHSMLLDPSDGDPPLLVWCSRNCPKKTVWLAVLKRLSIDDKPPKTRTAGAGANDGIEVEQDEPDLAEVADPYPEFPGVFGVLHELACVIAPSLAYAPKVLHLFTCVGLSISGRVKLATDTWLQTRFYSASTTPPGQAKTAIGVAPATVPRKARQPPRRD